MWTTEDSYEIDTPNVAFVVMQPGDYRMDVDPDGNRTEVTVWRGRGEATGGGNTYSMGANQHARFTGDGERSSGVQRRQTFPTRMDSTAGRRIATRTKIAPIRQTTFRAT